MKIISFQNRKHGYLMQYLIRESLEGYCCESELKLCLHAVTLNLSIDSILIKLLCVNFEEMKKEIYKMILKKDNEKL